MYKFATWAGGCVVLVLLLPQGGAVASDRTSAPEAGTFQAQIDVNSISGGNACLDQAGYTFVGSMSFPGLSGTTYALRAPETGSAGDNFGVDWLQTLTVKSGKGTVNPSGTFTWSIVGVGGSWTASGTFTGSVTEIGTHAFVLQLTEKYGSCTENLIIPMVRIGANQ